MAASIRGTAVTTAIAVVASLGLLLPGTPTVAAGAEQGSLSVAPDHGPAGSQARVEGAGFADDRTVEIRWEPTGERLGTTTGPEFSTTVSIPGDAAEGSHAIGARGQPPEAGAGDARQATTPFTVTAADDPDDVAAGEDDDRDSAAEDDGDEESGESGDEAGDDESGDDGDAANEADGDESGEADGDGDAGDGESSSDTSGDGAPQRTGMSPDPDDDAPAESEGQESGAQESDGQESGAQEADGRDVDAQGADSGDRDPQADPEPDSDEPDSDENEPSDPSEVSSGKAETATAAPRGPDDDGASSTDEDRSPAATYRKSSSGPPAAVSHEVGEVQPSAVEESPEVDFAAVLDSEAFQAQDAPAPEVAAAGPAQPDVAARERLATGGGPRAQQAPAATEPSTPQGTPAAVGTQAAAPNSEEVSLLVLLAASGALVVWHRRRQPRLRRR